jgi:hypothetical protein
MASYEIEQTETWAIMGVYEGETAADAIRAMLADADSTAEPDAGLVARRVAELESERREKIRNRANQVAASYAPGTAHTASTPEEYDEAETAVWREALREIDATAGADD